MYLIIEIQKSNDNHLAHLVTVHNNLPEAEQKYHDGPVCGGGVLRQRP